MSQKHSRDQTGVAEQRRGIALRLTSGEATLLLRALQGYAHRYRLLIQTEHAADPYEREHDRSCAGAADALGARIRGAQLAAK